MSDPRLPEGVTQTDDIEHDQWWDKNMDALAEEFLNNNEALIKACLIDGDVCAFEFDNFVEKEWQTFNDGE